jgi:hypothetical protein
MSEFLKTTVEKGEKLVEEWWEASGSGKQLGHTEQKAFGRMNLRALEGHDIILSGNIPHVLDPVDALILLITFHEYMA